MKFLGVVEKRFKDKEVVDEVVEEGGGDISGVMDPLGRPYSSERLS